MSIYDEVANIIHNNLETDCNKRMLKAYEAVDEKEENEIIKLLTANSME